MRLFLWLKVFVLLKANIAVVASIKSKSHQDVTSVTVMEAESDLGRFAHVELRLSRTESVEAREDEQSHPLAIGHAPLCVATPVGLTVQLCSGNETQYFCSNVGISKH